jgi:phage FluMu protein Com
MEEYRCPHPHPRRNGVCNALLFKARFSGWDEIEIKCWRCNRSVVIDLRGAYTAVDNLVMVS